MKLIASPPAANSYRQKRDLMAVLDAQAARTDAQIARAKATGDLAVAFADVLGPSFDAGTLPKTAAFFKKVQGDALSVMQAGKDHWNRPHPYQVSNEVNPLEKPASSSFPSGNALIGQLYAIVLADLIPERRAELFARGDETGDNRIIAGVHFPSDLEAGRRAAVAIAVALMANAAYQADFAEVRTEVRTALGL